MEDGTMTRDNNDESVDSTQYTVCRVVVEERMDPQPQQPADTANSPFAHPSYSTTK